MPTHRHRFIYSSPKDGYDEISELLQEERYSNEVGLLLKRILLGMCKKVGKMAY